MRIKRIYVKKHYISLRDIDCVFPIPGIAHHKCGVGFPDRPPNIVIPKRNRLVITARSINAIRYRTHIF